MNTKVRTTGIEWTDHTWNPFVGCSVKSTGCLNCYAMALAERLEGMGQAAYKGLTTTRNGKVYWTGKMNLSGPGALNKPLGIKKPAIFFVNSMSDFWHERALDEWRELAMDIIRRTPQHQYQILTKRPDSALAIIKRMNLKIPDNVWLGSTIEDAKAASERLELTKQFPARIKFLSIEPLVGPLGKINLSGIDWVISGGESGPSARPMKLEWMREIRDLCIEYNVPHFFKQWGKDKNNPLFEKAVAERIPLKALDPIGKGGSLLDGLSYKEMPHGFEVAAFAEMADESKA